MYLKRIVTRNLQNHKEVVVDLPPTGLVCFTGQNSNGKSVIVKATKFWVTGQIAKPRIRASLVNRDSSFGEIEYTRGDDVVLLLHTARQANLTYAKLTVPGEEPIVRYLADKSYKELISKFGWHFDAEDGITLNIAEAEEAMLFYKTSNKINAHLLETATSDSTANKAAEVFEAVLKDARYYRDQFVGQVNMLSSTLHELQVEEVQPLIDLREKLGYLYRNLSAVYFPNIPEIQPVPKVSYIDIYDPMLPAMRYPRIIDISCNIPDIVPVAKELQVLKEHRCPTCGRGFNCDC